MFVILFSQCSLREHYSGRNRVFVRLAKFKSSPTFYVMAIKIGKQLITSTSTNSLKNPCKPFQFLLPIQFYIFAFVGNHSHRRGLVFSTNQTTDFRLTIIFLNLPHNLNLSQFAKKSAYAKPIPSSNSIL